MSGKAYSIDEEEFMDWDDIMERLRDEHSIGERVEIFEGDSILAKHSEFINPTYIIEKMQEQAFEDYSEWSDLYLEDVLPDEEKLESLKAVLVEWFTAYASWPSFFKIKNTKLITVTVED